MASAALTFPWSSSRFTPAISTPFPGWYKPTWESLSRYQPPDWFRDAKFGIFLHWGVYSVPAHLTEWYPRLMYRRESAVFEWHKAHWGPQSKFGYKDFIPLFRAERWKPEEWVDLFRRIGAKYIVPVGEHCDGFPMYDCSLTEWCAAKMGPRRDVVGELAREVRNQRLKFGVSTHRNWHWSWYTYDEHFDTVNPRYSGLYGKPHPPTPPIDNRPGEILQTAPPEFLEDWYARTIEIVNRYRPDLLWLEWGVQAREFEPYRRELAAYFYNSAQAWGSEVVLTHKGNGFPPGAAVMDIERGTEAAIRERPWQTENSISKKSWGYIEDDAYSSPSEIIHEFVDIVSKNGNLLLNVGPKPDGTLPDRAVELLHQIGRWIDVNGEAIYGTRPWKVWSEGPHRFMAGSFSTRKAAPPKFTPQDIRFTARGEAIYAIFLAWPEGEARIQSLGSRSSNAPARISEVRLLGESERIKWRQTPEALIIEPPRQKPCHDAFAFRIR